MRQIRVPKKIWEMAKVDSGSAGAFIEYLVNVNWPELQLTEDQVVANAIARAYGKPGPYPDHSTFSVVLER